MKDSYPLVVTMLFPVPDSATLSEMMRSARQRLHLSQRQVAKMTGMSQQNYARIEKNPGIVGFDTVLLVLTALGLGMKIDDRRHAQNVPGAPENAPANDKDKANKSRKLPPSTIWNDETPEEF